MPAIQLRQIGIVGNIERGNLIVRAVQVSKVAVI